MPSWIKLRDWLQPEPEKGVRTLGAAYCMFTHTRVFSLGAAHAENVGDFIREKFSGDDLKALQKMAHCVFCKTFDYQRCVQGTSSAVPLFLVRTTCQTDPVHDVIVQSRDEVSIDNVKGTDTVTTLKEGKLENTEVLWPVHFERELVFCCNTCAKVRSLIHKPNVRRGGTMDLHAFLERIIPLLEQFDARPQLHVSSLRNARAFLTHSFLGWKEAFASEGDNVIYQKIHSKVREQHDRCVSCQGPLPSEALTTWCTTAVPVGQETSNRTLGYTMTALPFCSQECARRTVQLDDVVVPSNEERTNCVYLDAFATYVNSHPGFATNLMGATQCIGGCGSQKAALCKKCRFIRICSSCTRNPEMQARHESVCLQYPNEFIRYRNLATKS